jgi:hypothetical protein
MLRSSERCFYFPSSRQIFAHISLFPHKPCKAPPPLILRDLITLIIFSEEYKSPRYETSASVLPLPNIFLSTWNTYWALFTSRNILKTSHIHQVMHTTGLQTVQPGKLSNSFCILSALYVFSSTYQVDCVPNSKNSRHIRKILPCVRIWKLPHTKHFLFIKFCTILI